MPTPKPYASLGENMQRRRKRMKGQVTQGDVAAMVNKAVPGYDITYHAVQKWESGRSLPGRPMLWPHIEHIYGLTSGTIAEVAGVQQQSQDPGPTIDELVDADMDSLDRQTKLKLMERLIDSLRDE